ncbi:hypothetical protein OGX85_26695 [Serratia marcescens]|uniref:hypothetical protein n=1 Tax=Serratia marcescens TaxID=615 RepID=UPI0024B2A1DD|nr:hypothetical protein [Serratia marcescens]MDI9110870.1 hypothetical protein [Serratia marcescens]
MISLSPPTICNSAVGCFHTLGYHLHCRFQKTAALNVRSRLHYSSGGVGSIRQRRAAAGHQRTQGGLSAALLQIVGGDKLIIPFC